MTSLSTIDWLVVAGYFLVLLGIVLAVVRKQTDTTEYFLADKGSGGRGKGNRERG